MLGIDGLRIASDGTIKLDGESVPYTEVVERKFKGELATLDILRDGSSQQVKIPLSDPWPFALQSNAYDEKPQFVVFGGLVFQPVDKNFMDDFNPGNLRLDYLFDFFVEDGIYRDRPQLVVLSNILADGVNAYAKDFLFAVVDEINGQKIHRISDVAAAFAKPSDYYVIQMLGIGRPLVLERKAVEGARSRILQRYGVTSEHYLKK